MKKTVSTIEVRKQLGEILDRVALRHDQFIIERKGKPLATVVPIEQLEQLERAARRHLLFVLKRQTSSLTQTEADELADAAKHKNDESLRVEVDSLLAQDRPGILDAPAVAAFELSLLDEDEATLAGRTVSHYEVGSEISRGGMGIVYRAHDVNSSETSCSRSFRPMWWRPMPGGNSVS